MDPHGDHFRFPYLRTPSQRDYFNHHGTRPALTVISCEYFKHLYYRTESIRHSILTEFDTFWNVSGPWTYITSVHWTWYSNVVVHYMFFFALVFAAVFAIRHTLHTCFLQVFSGLGYDIYWRTKVHPVVYEANLKRLQYRHTRTRTINLGVLLLLLTALVSIYRDLPDWQALILVAIVLIVLLFSAAFFSAWYCRLFVPSAMAWLHPEIADVTLVDRMQLDAAKEYADFDVDGATGKTAPRIRAKSRTRSNNRLYRSGM